MCTMDKITITAINNSEVKTVSELVELLHQYDPNDTVILGDGRILLIPAEESECESDASVAMGVHDYPKE